MSYDHTIPNAANVVRGASGDLALMKANFQELAAVVSAARQTGSAPNDYLDGWTFGNDAFRITVSGGELWLQKKDGGTWSTAAYLPSGGQWVFSGTVSGVTPTASDHLATKGYVDTVSAALSGEIAAVPDTLSGLTDTSVSGATGGQALVFNEAMQKWVPLDYKLSGLTDTAVSGAVSGQALVYVGSGEWQPGDVATELTVEEDDGSPSVSGVSKLVVSGQNGVTVTVVSSAQGEATFTVSGDAHESLFKPVLASGDQTYAAGLSALSGLSGLTPPGSPVSGGTEYAADLGLPILKSGTGNSTYLVQFHVGASGDEVSDPVAYKAEVNIGNSNPEKFVGMPGVPLTIASGELVTVAVSGSDGFTIRAASGQHSYLRIRDGIALGAGADSGGGGGGGGSDTLSGLTDTSVSGVTSGQFLQFNGSAWEPSLLRAFILSGTADGTGSVTISGIPQNANDLVVDVIGSTERANVNDQIALRFNSISGSEYDSSLHVWESDANHINTAGDGRSLNELTFGFFPGANGNDPGFARATIPFYTVSGLTKFLVGQSGREDGNDVVVSQAWGRWSSVSAITSVEVLSVNANLSSGTVIRVWGR